MSEPADRFRKVAAAFTDRVEGVSANAWDNPAPCEGWVARDVVVHLVEWLPSFFGAWGVPSASSDDLATSWRTLRDAIQAGLDDPSTATQEEDVRPGRYSFEQAIDTFCTPDVLVHTWDLARATGQDETLDPAEVRRLFAAMEPYDEVLRSSGQYGPRVPVPDDADEQTKLIAFTGRTP